MVRSPRLTSVLLIAAGGWHRHLNVQVPAAFVGEKAADLLRATA